MSHAAPPPPAPEPAVECQGLKVLVVDDEPDVRAITCERLQTLGCVVKEAAAPAEALRLLEMGEPVDVLVTDFVMPGMDGRTLLTRARITRPGLPAVIVSAFTDDGIDPLALAPRGTAVLAKPFSTEALAARLRDVIASR